MWTSDLRAPSPQTQQALETARAQSHPVGRPPASCLDLEPVTGGPSGHSGELIIQLHPRLSEPAPFGYLFAWVGTPFRETMQQSAAFFSVTKCEWPKATIT